jgi:hypothetical protein
MTYALRLTPVLVATLLVASAACDGGATTAGAGPHRRTDMTANGTVRIGYLHHSTGKAVWDGGVPEAIQRHNAERGTDYRISHVWYPATTGGWPPIIRRLAKTYPWANYPYDYWNLWVNHTGARRDRREMNLDDLVGKFDVIVFKHCFPVSRVKPDGATPSVSSDERTLSNYKLQYEALKARLRKFPATKFVVWTGAALPEASTSAAEAERAREFFTWVKTVWDEKGDNVFVWDFHELETEGGLYLRPEYANGPRDAHPSAAFARTVAPLVAQRIIDVIEGRADESRLDGRAVSPATSQASAPKRAAP